MVQQWCLLPCRLEPATKINIKQMLIGLMMPDRCSVVSKKVQCVNPPRFIVSIVDGPDEYMVGLACETHRQTMSEKITMLQKDRKIPNGVMTFSPVKAVGTDCIRGDPDDLVQIDTDSKN